MATSTSPTSASPGHYPPPAAASRPRPAVAAKKPAMVWLWTAAGTSFGYRLGDELWSLNGRHCGQFVGDQVFGRTGAYRGELTNGNRLLTDPAKRHLRSAAFTPALGWVGMPARPGKPPFALPAGYEDFV